MKRDLPRLQAYVAAQDIKNFDTHEDDLRRRMGDERAQAWRDSRVRELVDHVLADAEEVPCEA